MSDGRNRCVGVIGGIFVCMGYAVRITDRAVEVVTGADKAEGIVAVEASGVGVGIRKRLGNTDLRLRNHHQSWADGGGSAYSSYAGTPVSGGFPSPQFAGYPSSPYAGSVTSPPPSAPPLDRRSSSGLGFGLNSPSFGPVPMTAPLQGRRSPNPSFPTAATAGSPYSGQLSVPPTPGTAQSGLYTHFPPTPNPATNSFPRSPLPGGSSFAAQQSPLSPPPPRSSGLRQSHSDSKAKGS